MGLGIWKPIPRFTIFSVTIGKFLQLEGLSFLLCKTMTKTSVSEVRYNLGCGSTLSTLKAVPLLIMIVMIEFNLFLSQ